MEVESGEWRYASLPMWRTKAGKTRLFLPPSDTSAAFLSYKYGEIVR